MEFSISPIQGIHGYRLEGELDLATVGSLAQRLEEAADAGGPILLDVSALKFIDSTGIHAILKAVTGLEERGWCIYLHTDDGEVLRVLELVGLSKVRNLHIVDHAGAHTPRA